jgi:hypothetical protein
VLFQITGESETRVVAVDASYNTSKVVIDLAEKKEDQLRQSEISLMPQLDGVCESESQKNQSKEIFSFKSDFAEEDIEYCLDEIFKDTNVTSKQIILKDQLRPRSADYLYTLELKMDKENIHKSNFSWPKMSSSQKEVSQNLKRIF